MVCVVKTYEKPVLKDPVLIEGLPGIGFVANIAALHMIQELKAKSFIDIRSSAFQDFAVASERGVAQSPVNKLYYYVGKNGGRDLVILYGNTQALTTWGQYELCGCILDIAESLGCSYIVTLGGLRRKEKISSPKLFCAATDEECLGDALKVGAEPIQGQIFGCAGLLIGLGKTRDFKGFCLLAETPGYYPDAVAAREILKAVSKMLGLKIDLRQLNVAAEKTKDILQSFGLIGQQDKEKEMEEYKWFI